MGATIDHQYFVMARDVESLVAQIKTEWNVEIGVSDVRMASSHKDIDFDRVGDTWIACTCSQERGFVYYDREEEDLVRSLAQAGSTQRFWEAWKSVA